MIALVLTMMALWGCAIALKPDFVEKANNNLGIKPVVYPRADWIQGVYGHPSFSEALTSKISIIRGALVGSKTSCYWIAFFKKYTQIQGHRISFPFRTGLFKSFPSPFPGNLSVRVFLCKKLFIAAQPCNRVSKVSSGQCITVLSVGSHQCRLINFCQAEIWSVINGNPVCDGYVYSQWQQGFWGFYL